MTPQETLKDRLAKRRRIRQKKISESNSYQNTPTITRSLDRLSSRNQIESSTPSIRQDLTTIQMATSHILDSSIVSLPNPDSYESSPTYLPDEKSFQLDEKPLILPPIPAPRRRHLPPHSSSVTATPFSRTHSEQVIPTHQSIILTRHNSSALTYLFHRQLIGTENCQLKTTWD